MITITIDTDNAAFEGHDELVYETARILRQLATDILNDEFVDNSKLTDINGNIVGKIEVTE